MRAKHLRWFVTVAILPVVLLPREMAYAQGEQGERGRIEFGVRQIYGDRQSAKFNEYRDLPKGFFIRHSEWSFHNLLDNTFFFTAQTRYSRNQDQSYLFDLGRHRKYHLELLWDQTPHVFTNTAKSFFVETSPGVFTVPGAVRSFLQSNPPTATNVASLQAVLDSAHLLDMSLRSDKGAGTFTFTPASDWTVQLGYSKEKKKGYRPFGTTINSFTSPIELPEPIDYRTHQVKTGAEYAIDRGGIQATYVGSIFNNEVSTLVWDNPFRTTDAFPAGGSRGRLDLYPDNNAHRLRFAGALNIPHSTRFMASIVPGWMRQNDPFLPFTINTADPTTATNPGPCPGKALTDVGCLPGQSLGGSKQTLAMNYTLTSKAIRNFPLTFRYRSYDYNNNTPSITFSQYISTDGSLSSAIVPRRSLPYAYDRKTLGLDASWDFLKNSDVKFLYEWERMDREHREVEQSTEHSVGAAFDLNPLNWLLFKASYRHSQRDPEEYEVNEESFPQGEGTALGELHSLRKLDQAERTRHRAEALLQLTPVDQFSFGASYGTTQDGYQKSGCIWLGYDQCYGLLKDISYNYTFELTYTPRSDLSLYAEYTREKYNYRQRSRQRTATNDNPNNDWETDRRDLVDVWATGVDASLLSDKVLFNAFWNLSAAKNRILTRALGTSGAPGTPTFLPVTAQNYPDTSNRWHQLVTTLRFPLKGGFTPQLQYRYEKYDRVDFQLENVAQYPTLDPSSATAIYLGVGADIPGYDAHIVEASLEYRF